MKMPSAIIRRESYLQRIEPFIGKSVIKVLTGQRRVGKSYILFQLIQKIQEEDSKANIIYINKEDMRFDTLNSAESLNEYVLAHIHNQKENHLFIDEIQDIVGFEKALRSLQLIENIDIYITGSNAKMLSGELATYLAGRYIEFTIYSLSYQEFMQFHSLNDSDKSFALFSKYGGLPYLKNLKLEDSIVFEYLKGIYITILYRDIIARHAIRNMNFLERFVTFLSDNIGSVFSAKSISDYLKSQDIKLASNQILSYADYLTQAFIIHKVSRFDLIGKRIFEFGEKYYFENIGIRNAIVGYKVQDRAKILENIVYSHLLYRGYEIKVGIIGTQEIDFVCTKEGEKIYIQVALQLGNEATIEREFGNLLKIKDNYPKIVVTQDQFAGNTYKGILHYNIREFLLRSCFNK